MTKFEGIELSNGHVLKYVVASGAMAFDGRGWWPIERVLVWLGIIKLDLFTVFMKTITLEPRKGNLVWWNPWRCIRLLRGGGVVNKVAFTNGGLEWWCRDVGSKMKGEFPLAGSITGTKDEMVAMAKCLNNFNLVALEVNGSCINDHIMSTEEFVVAVIAVRCVSRFPIIAKVSVAQDYLAIADALRGVAEVISINSVPWETAFPAKCSPLHHLQQKVGGSGGGVSGRPAQRHNWEAVQKLVKQNALPVIAPSVMSFGDVEYVAHSLKAPAVSFGAIHIWFPWRPTRIVKRLMQ